VRRLTPEEEVLKQRRRAQLSPFLAQKGPVLADFAERLELADPSAIVTDPMRCLPAIAAFMRDQEISANDRVWIHTRLGYFIGDLLAQRFGGRWFLNEIPDSRYFLHYVVGEFAGVKNPNAMVAPFEVADDLLRQPPGRDLAALVGEVERELRSA
jgi:hypothetical protein